ncbi:S-methyl-5-thioribose kinase [Streptobacillus canis]|uniref:S-methyl-5-thioribose kinase n=1 Tax=Streptobacillus canis TaxID=2678686 RepID=UPI0012E2BFE1|nr:S-methyl-5-thioribose kinase [Streptobacillus canis]
MNKYSKHFLLDLETVKEYIKDNVNFFEKDENLISSEIGDGNINYVFRVRGEKSNKSIIVKQADKLLRSSGRPLDLNRNKIEYLILKIESELCPSYIPKIYHYDENMYALVMEDIGEYKNLRTEFLNDKMFLNFANEISTFLVDSLLPTTDLVLPRDIKKERVKEFVNVELCDISEDLVFTEPYYNYKNRNIITNENLEYFENLLYKDEKLHKEVAVLRNKFMNYAQGLIHGDLHSGSIFINEKGIKIIDPEFAFYGPIGYDIGNVIGNLFFAYANAFYERENKEFVSYISNTIKDILDMFIDKFSKKYDEIVTFPLYKVEEFKKEYMENVISDSIGYAATEIIRRTVGDAKVKEVSAVSDINKKIKLERSLVELGIFLIKNRKGITNGEMLINLSEKFFK